MECRLLSSVGLKTIRIQKSNVSFIHESLVRQTYAKVYSWVVQNPFFECNLFDRNHRNPVERESSIHPAPHEVTYALLQCIEKEGNLMQSASNFRLT